jgi:phenylalanyl-tRNA synthetase beta chain
LGEESRFLRTKLLLSLVKAAKDNSGESGPFHLFEIANVYLPRKNNLPEERLILAGIFANCEYRRAKGTIECLLDMLNIKPNFSQKDYDKFLLNQSVSIKVGQESLGKLGILKKNLIYYEFEITALAKAYSPIASYKPLPKYPAQIEDITFKMPEKTKIGHLISSITLIDQTIKTVELKDIYKNFYTFTIKYQHPQKTLTNAEVEKIRKKVIKQVKQKFGGVIKD